MADSTADIFFRKLTSEGSDAFAMVDDLINKGAEENEWWEFKDAQPLHTPFFYNKRMQPLAKATAEEADKEKNRQATIKKYWSEALSAFANAGGGLLIWGIHAPIRRAESRTLAPNAGHLADRLKELQNDAVDPSVPGVEVLAVPEAGSQAGFVVCHIPRSDFSPHRATFAGSAYYLRTGDSSQPMQTEVLRRMFYPHTFPRLVPVASLAVVSGGARGLLIQMRVVLKNYGSASARETYVRASWKAVQGFDVHWDEDCWEKRSSGGHQSKFTIHPEDEISLIRNLTNRSGYADLADLEPLTFAFHIFTEDAPPLVATLTFDRQELQNAAIERKPIDRRGNLATKAKYFPDPMSAPQFPP